MRAFGLALGVALLPLLAQLLMPAYIVNAMLAPSSTPKPCDNWGPRCQPQCKWRPTLSEPRRCKRCDVRAQAECTA